MEFMRHKTSIRFLLRAILNTETYQRSCSHETPYEKENFSRAAVKQLSGEQLINSIQVATLGRPGRKIDEARAMVEALFPAGAPWTEVTPLPGSMRQALLLRNNPQIMTWIKSGAVLQRIKSGAGPVERKVEEMFLAALSRMPSDLERARYADFVGRHPDQGFEDAYWTLLNTPEFVTRH